MRDDQAKTIDKTSLKNAIKEAKTIEKADCTPEVYKSILNSIKTGEAVLNNEKATQIEVDNAANEVMNVQFRTKLVKKKVNSIVSTLSALPPNKEEASLITKKIDLILKLTEVDKKINEAKAFGISDKVIQSLSNYERIDIAKRRVNLIEQSEGIFDQIDYVFGRYGNVKNIHGNNINIKVENDERLGEVFDGHAIIDYIKNNSSKIIQPTVLKIGDRVIRDVNFFEISCKNDINAAFTSFVNKTKFADVMLDDLKGKSFTATFKINDENIDYIFSFDIGTIDKVVLGDEIKATKALNKDKYTAQSYKVLEDAVISAEVVLKDYKASETDMDKAYRGIKDAENSLKEIVPTIEVDKTELGKAIEKAKAVKEGDCTKEIYLTIQDKIKQGEALVNNNEATQTQVASKANEITKVLEGAVKAQTDADKIVEALEKLPENKEAAALILDKNELQSLINNVNAKIKAARLTGVTDKEIKELANYERLAIGQNRVKIIDQNEIIIDETKYISTIKYIDIQNVDVNYNVDMVIKDGGALLKDAIKAETMRTYMKDNKKMPRYPASLKVGDVTLTSGNPCTPKGKKSIDDAFVKLAGKNTFDEITLADLKGKSFIATFKVVSSSEVIEYTFNFK